MAREKEMSKVEIQNLLERKAALIDRTAHWLYDHGIRVTGVTVLREIQNRIGIPEENFLDAVDEVKEILKRKGWVREDIWG